MVWKITKKTSKSKEHVLVRFKKDKKHYHPLCKLDKSIPPEYVMNDEVVFRVGSFVNCNCKYCKKSSLYDAIVAKAVLLKMKGVFEIRELEQYFENKYSLWKT